MASDDTLRAIYHAIRSIPCGRVAAYGEVATRAGLPGRARLVGRLLQEAPESARLPWHRVLRADRSLAFPDGSEMHDRQARLLGEEGVILVAGKVPRRFFTGPEQELDALLWGPERQ